MDTHEVAAEFTRLYQAGQLEEAGRRFWSDKVVSLEAMDGPMSRCTGIQEVVAKGQWWTENHDIHSFEAEGPYVNGNQFALQFAIDVTPKTGEARRPAHADDGDGPLHAGERKDRRGAVLLLSGWGQARLPRLKGHTRYVPTSGMERMS